MTDVGFVIAGFIGILGGLALYAVTLALRLRRTRREESVLRSGGREAAGPDGGRPEPQASPAVERE